MIGDTDTDHFTARAAGVPSVLVGFGPNGPAVAQLNPDAVLAHYDDLPDLAAQLLRTP
jgi:phosphoglycolate phosphatase